jgi:hypothetical protein
MSGLVSSVGYSIPGQVAESLEFKSTDSILGADIVVFSPDISSYSNYQEGAFQPGDYAGQKLINHRDSALLREHIRHWDSELSTLLQHGKTIFLVLSAAEPCWIQTGQKEFSGTGRSQRVKNLVASFDPYSVVPVADFSNTVHRSSGDRIKPTKDVGLLASYWQEFGLFSHYVAYLDKLTTACLVTKTGDKIVGGLALTAGWKGALVLLPPVDFDTMVSEREKQLSGTKDGGVSAAITRKAEKSVGKQFVNALVQIDKAIRAQAARTPAPSWVLQDEFALREEGTLKEEIASIDREIVELQNARQTARVKLEEAGNLKGLLYESGAPLESALLEALRVLGFTAENYRDAESEFDVLFVDPEGEKLLGEAEGKTDKAINIEKLDQLNRNVQEEFAKRPDAQYSKGVLFGNAFRLTPLNERGDFFTQKCLAGAVRSGFALVRTPDLFPIARYLKENLDPDFAIACRKEVLNTSGKVAIFPPIPKVKAAAR